MTYEQLVTLLFTAAAQAEESERNSAIAQLSLIDLAEELKQSEYCWSVTHNILNQTISALEITNARQFNSIKDFEVRVSELAEEAASYKLEAEQQKQCALDWHGDWCRVCEQLSEVQQDRRVLKERNTNQYHDISKLQRENKALKEQLEKAGNVVKKRTDTLLNIKTNARAIMDSVDKATIG
jgi:chromosome segregation ATPase